MIKSRLLLISILLFATSLCLNSCKKNSSIKSCDGVLSESGPWVIALKLIDKDSKENLLLKKVIDTAQLKIINQKDQSTIPKYIHTTNGFVFFSVPEKTENYQIKMQTGKTDPISLTFSSSVKPLECGISHEVKDLSVSNYPFVISEQSFRRYILEVSL